MSKVMKPIFQQLKLNANSLKIQRVTSDRISIEGHFRDGYFERVRLVTNDERLIDVYCSLDVANKSRIDFIDTVKNGKRIQLENPQNAYFKNSDEFIKILQDSEVITKETK